MKEDNPYSIQMDPREVMGSGIRVVQRSTLAPLNKRGKNRLDAGIDSSAVCLWSDRQFLTLASNCGEGERIGGLRRFHILSSIRAV